MTIVDEYIRRSHRNIRVSEGEAIENSQIVSKLNDKIDRIVRDLDKGIISRDAAQLKISTLVEETFGKQIPEKAESDSFIIAQKEIEWNIGVLSQYSHQTINSINSEIAASKVAREPFQGRTFNNWFRREGSTATRHLMAALRSAYVEGLDINQTTKLLEGVLGKSNKNIKTLTRSYMLATANVARNSIFEENSDIIEGTIWVSTLDIRTTVNICGIRDQKLYDNNKKPIGHNLPYEQGPGSIHFNCRSIEAPKIKGVPLTTTRVAIGAGEEYERGDNKTNRGTVRKPVSRNIDKGYYKIDQVTNRTNYESFMRRQKLAYIADAFNSMEKAKKFKSGASLMEVTNNYPLGVPIRITEL